MPLSDRPKFFPSRDLHILRGDPPTALWKLLQVSFSTGPDNTESSTFDAYKAQHDDVDIQLRPVSDVDEVGTKLVISNGIQDRDRPEHGNANRRDTRAA